MVWGDKKRSLDSVEREKAQGFGALVPGSIVLDDG
jgi:hypothetical protein